MPIFVPSHPYGPNAPTSPRDLQKVVVKYAQAHLKGLVVFNLGSGDQITVSMGGVKHSVHGANVPLLETLSQLPLLLAVAQKTGVLLDKENRPEFAATHKYEVDVVCGGRNLQGLIIVREDRSGLKNFYDLAFLLV